MKKDILKVGIAGFGVVGKKRYHFIEKSLYLKTLAVSDVRFGQNDFDQTADQLIKDKNIKTFNDYNKLFDLDMDILFVCLPNYLAPDATIMGLNNNCHVFCEKPPGKEVKDIINVMKIEKNNPKLKLKYGFNHRYHGSVEKAKEIIDSNNFGKIISFRGLYGKSRIVPFSGGWRCERKYSGGGILLDQGIHMLDLLRYFCGNFESVQSFISNKFWNHDVEDNAFAILKNNNGCIASIHSSATQWSHSFRLEITLEKGMLELSGILSGSKSYGEEKLKIIERKDDSISGAHSEKIINYLDDNSWKNEVDEFADIIIKDKKVINGNSADALGVMKMVYNIYYSDKQWRKIFNIENPN
tara:strand:- start:2351 stop:3415 length:1065 start_codon:yes stop_codon:yes gene_type:complete